jgi:hypothetical protein
MSRTPSDESYSEQEAPKPQSEMKLGRPRAKSRAESRPAGKGRKSLPKKRSG